MTTTTTIRATVRTFQAPRESEGRKATTVTRIATLTPAIPVTVDTRSVRGCKNDAICKHRDPDPHDPCDFSHFRNAKRIRGSKSDNRYGAVIATPTPAIPVTVDAFSKSERFTPPKKINWKIVFLMARAIPDRGKVSILRHFFLCYVFLMPKTFF